MNDLMNCILKFRSLNVENLQMDFLRDNGQVLLQVFKYDQIVVHRPQMQFNKKSGYVLELYFHKSKVDNSKNETRFKESSDFSSFVQFEGFEPKGAYYRHFNEDISNEYLEQYLSNFLFEVYGKLEFVDIRVRN